MINKEYKEFVEKASEPIIYFMIEEAAAYIHHMGLKFINKEIKPEHIIQVQKSIQEVSDRHKFLVNNAMRFGVNEIYEEKNGKSYSSLEYRRWYTHWDNWKKNLTNTQWETVRNKLAKGETFNDLLPTTKWND